MDDNLDHECPCPGNPDERQAFIVDPDAEPIKDAWMPPKKVMIHPKEFWLQEQNPNLFQYWHLTNHYFYRKPGPNGTTYDLSSIDPAIFKQKYIDTEKPFYRDPNHPELYRDVILDLEMNHVWKTEDVAWWQWTQEYINIARMMKAAGKPVAIYGVHLEALEFQTWWNLGRFTYQSNPDLHPDQTRGKYYALKLEEYKEKEYKLMDKLDILSRRFNPEIDAVVLSLYCPYEISEKEMYGWKWFAFQFYINSAVDSYSAAFPGKPIYAFIQPNFTTTWNPMSTKLWNEYFKIVMENDKIDRVYLFNMRNKEKPKDWERIIRDGYVS